MSAPVYICLSWVCLSVCILYLPIISLSMALSTLKGFRLKTHFSLLFVLLSTLRQRFCQDFWKPSPKWMNFCIVWKRRLLKTEAFENDDAYLVMCHIISIYIYVYTSIALFTICAIHFHTIATDVLLCTLFISQSCKDERKCTCDCCLHLNMRAVEI